MPAAQTSKIQWFPFSIHFSFASHEPNLKLELPALSIIHSLPISHICLAFGPSPFLSFDEALVNLRGYKIYNEER